MFAFLDTVNCGKVNVSRKTDGKHNYCGESYAGVCQNAYSVSRGKSCFTPPDIREGRGEMCVKNYDLPLGK